MVFIRVRKIPAVIPLPDKVLPALREEKSILTAYLSNQAFL